MPPRFTPEAAAALRRAIAEAGGVAGQTVEVFAIADVDAGGRVCRVEIHCRGTSDAVPAMLRRPRAGQVCIHNHPSGNLTPSRADFELAHRYGDEGVGVVIVDDDVRRDNWVVEPARPRAAPVDRDRLEAFFTEDLPRILPGCERRDGQLAMAMSVADALDEGGVLIAEAGTGTGKSLAYLAPAVLWAVANDTKVAVSTHTIHLQSQLLTSDIPLLRRAGIEFSSALIKGRGNYICRRKLAVAAADGGDDGALYARIARWAEQNPAGTRQDFGEAIDAEAWERVQSDAHQTLRARCPHYNRCFYYEARRQAAASHLLVVNHALLLSDLAIKALGGSGVIPRVDRVVIDEGHHLEDAATSAGARQLTARAVSRATRPLLDRKRRRGALTRIMGGRLAKKDPQLFASVAGLADRVAALGPRLEERFREISMIGLGEQDALRITPDVEGSEAWSRGLDPALESLASQIEDVAAEMVSIQQSVDLKQVLQDEVQPWLDLARARVRLEAYADVARQVRRAGDDTCRWLERDGARDFFGGLPRLRTAPIEVGPWLRENLFDPVHSAVVTSATLTVRGSFDHYLDRHGLVAPPAAPDPDEITYEPFEGFADAPPVPPPRGSLPPAPLAGVGTGVYPSPFDYTEQAILALPRDLPDPGDPRWIDAVGAALVRLIDAAGGGAFVLCTSYTQVREFSARIRAGARGRYRVLAQSEAPRQQLLARYVDSPDAVLVGTDSFWEGVSVRGDALRMVLIPRLPFRVPTEPVAQARHERLEAAGRDPFRALSLPQAVIKLRQGFGRLIRARDDRGAVVVLDRRVLGRWYGRSFLLSLPPARRITGPLRSVVGQLERFYGER